MFLCALSALLESAYSTRFHTWRTDRDVLLALPHHPSSVPERAADHVCHHTISVGKGPTVFIVDHHQLHDCAAAEVLTHSECHPAEPSPASSLATAPSPPAPVPPSSSALLPTRLPATTLAMPRAASQPAPALNQPFPAASNAAPASAPSTTALAPPYAASSAALAPAPPPMASDAAHTILGTAAFSAMPSTTSTSLAWWVAWWVATAVYLFLTFACFSLTFSPPPVAPPAPAAASSASGGAAVPPAPLHSVPPAPAPAATPADVLARLQQRESYRKLRSIIDAAKRGEGKIDLHQTVNKSDQSLDKEERLGSYFEPRKVLKPNAMLLSRREGLNNKKREKRSKAQDFLLHFQIELD